MEKEKRTVVMAHVPVYLLEDLRRDIESLHDYVHDIRDHLDDDISRNIVSDITNISSTLVQIISTYREDIDYEKAKKIIRAYYLNDQSYFYTLEDLKNAQACIGVGIAKGEIDIVGFMDAE